MPTARTSWQEFEGALGRLVLAFARCETKSINTVRRAVALLGGQWMIEGPISNAMRAVIGQGSSRTISQSLLAIIKQSEKGDKIAEQTVVSCVEQFELIAQLRNALFHHGAVVGLGDEFHIENYRVSDFLKTKRTVVTVVDLLAASSDCDYIIRTISTATEFAILSPPIGIYPSSSYTPEPWTWLYKPTEQFPLFDRD